MKHTHTILLSTIAYLLAWQQASHFACAQTHTETTLCGTVINTATSKPLSAVRITLVGTETGAMTKTDGTFCITLPVQQALVRLRVQRFGLAVQTLEVSLEQQRIKPLVIRLAERTFEMENVTVIAREESRHSEGSTVSRIDRAAIEHVQASNLADVLQLVPGQLAQNPTFQNEQQSLLRQNPTNADANRANALGTAVVLDGTPLSNNANMQSNVTILNAGPSSLPPFASVAGRGMDLREIPAANIASVEVVRGIPSARHGDLTAGAILVETLAGAMKPQLLLRANPNLLEGDISAGFGNGVNESGFNAGVNIVRAQDDPRITTDNFYRLTANTAWTQPWVVSAQGTPTLATTLRLAYTTTLDEDLDDPDDRLFLRERFSREWRLRTNLNGFWKFNILNTSANTASMLRWTFSATTGEQNSFFQDMITRSDVFPITAATPRIGADTTTRGIFAPVEYLNKTTVNGRPLNLYGRVEASHLLTFETNSTSAPFALKPMLGVEYRLDANFGAGRQFDVLTPPRQNYSVGERPRSYDDIPPLTQLSGYAEILATGSIALDNANRPFSLVAGVRYDNISPTSLTAGRFGTTLVPRINASFEPIQGLELRAGYGITAKAPVLAHLYPNPQFLDVVNYSLFADSAAERLVVMTSRAISTAPASLRAFTTEKAEIGINARVEGFRATLVAYNEETRGAVGISRLVHAMPFARLRAMSFPRNAPPILAPEPMRLDTFLGQYDTPIASRRIATRGVEWTLDAPEITAIRTTLNLSGAWTFSTATDTALAVDYGALTRFANAPPRIGVFLNDEQRESERLVTSLRVINRFPEIGLVLSWLVQTIWVERDRFLALSEIPRGFVDKTGRMTLISQIQAESDNFKDIRRPFDQRLLLTEDRPPLWLLNVRLSKTLPAGLQLAFYVNNLLADRPLYFQRRNERFTERNIELFFGLELQYTIPLEAN
ncbi:MAG: TonB-dependent receptor [Candidatus Kapaibacterium sp.]|nr:MAG: TonB-dependent receptor [Candidatus Kapabacteria bacterium]